LQHGRLTVEAEVEAQVDVLECQMVDITKDTQIVEETVTRDGNRSGRPTEAYGLVYARPG